jgi:hypothetical protein
MKKRSGICVDSFGCRELSGGIVLLPRHKLELARREPRLYTGADLPKGGFPHAAPQCVAENSAVIGNGLALEAALAGKGYSLLRSQAGFFGSTIYRSLTAALAGLRNNPIRLVAKLGGKFAVRTQNFSGRLHLLFVARCVRRDFGRLKPR